MSYHIRIDIESKSDIVQKILSVSSKWAYAQEGQGSDLHTHIVCFSETPVNTLRNWIRKTGKELGYSGNGFYSISTLRDQIKALAYIMKEGDFQQQGFDDIMSEVQNYREDYKEKKKKDPISIVDKIWELLPEDVKDPSIHSYDVKEYNKFGVLNISHHVSNRYASESCVRLYILDYHLTNKLVIRRNTFQTILDTIMCRLNPGGYIDRLFREDPRN